MGRSEFITHSREEELREEGDIGVGVGINKRERHSVVERPSSIASISHPPARESFSSSTLKLFFLLNSSHLHLGIWNFSPSHIPRHILILLPPSPLDAET